MDTNDYGDTVAQGFLPQEPHDAPVVYTNPATPAFSGEPGEPVLPVEPLTIVAAEPSGDYISAGPAPEL
jgi:hypothetical protein